MDPQQSKKKKKKKKNPKGNPKNKTNKIQKTKRMGIKPTKNLKLRKKMSSFNK